METNTLKQKTLSLPELKCIINVLYLFCFQVALLGLDLLSALVTRLQDRFRAQVGTGEVQLHRLLKQTQ